MTPRAVDDCTLWELAAAVAGYNRVHGGEAQPEAMSSEEFDDMLARHAEWIAGRRGG